MENDVSAGRFMIHARPFMEAHMKGWMNFEVTLLQGTMQISLGQNPKPYQSRNDQALLMGSENSQLTLRLETDKEILVAKERIASPQVSELQANKPYQIRISWDFTTAEPGYSISINGEPTHLLKNGGPFRAAVTPAEASSGVDSFAISTPREVESRYIIGNVTVSE